MIITSYDIEIGDMDINTFKEEFLTYLDTSGGPDACWPYKKARAGNY